MQPFSTRPGWQATRSSWPREITSGRESFPKSVGSAVRVGHDAVSVVDIGLSGQPDEKIRAYAMAENRLLLTLDGDFGNLLRFPTAGTPGVIRLKIHPLTEKAIREQIQISLALLKDTPLAGCLAVCYGDMARIRS